MSRRTTHRLPVVSRRSLWRRCRALDHRLAGAERLIRGQQIRITDLERQVEQHAADAVDVSVLRKQLAAAEETERQLRKEYLAVKADLENLGAITVPPAVRDIDPDDQPTEAIYAQTLRDHMAAQEQRQTTPAVTTLAEALGGAA